MNEKVSKKSPSTLANSPRILELKKKRLRVWKLKIFLYLFLLIIFLAGLGFLSRWTEININTVVVSGNKIVDESRVSKIINEELAGYYFWVFPKKNFVIYPKKVITKRLISEIKRLEGAELNVTDTKVLEVSVTERKAVYTWCGEDLGFYDIEDSINDEVKKCYFMDEEGYVFDNAPYFSGAVYFKFFGLLENPSIGPLGQSYAPEHMTSILTFLDEIESMNLQPTSLFIKKDGEIDLYLKSSVFNQDMNKIMINTDSDFQKAAENLNAAVNTEPLKLDLKERYEELLYVDLRFGNKIYYKFK